jgi:hypothetical protein
MVKNYMSKYSTSLPIKEKKIEATIRFYLTPVLMAHRGPME